jgi:hypothetical protein
MKNAGYLCGTSIYAVRRQLGKKVDGESSISHNMILQPPYLRRSSGCFIKRLTNLVAEKYTSVQRSQHLTQADPRVFGQSYVANCSSVDGQAAFLREALDHRHVDYFQSLANKISRRSRSCGIRTDFSRTVLLEKDTITALWVVLCRRCCTPPCCLDIDTRVIFGAILTTSRECHVFPDGITLGPEQGELAAGSTALGGAMNTGLQHSTHSHPRPCRPLLPPTA